MDHEDILATARVLNVVRGGTWDLCDEDRDRARKIRAAWPQAGKMLGHYDKFRSWVAADAVARGATAVVFGGAAGFPVGGSPHAEASLADPGATFWYVGADDTIVGQRRQSLAGDRRARAFNGSFRDASSLVSAVRRQGAADGPWQVQWGFGGGVMDDDEGRRLAASYARLLAPGSELVICTPEGEQGRAFASIAGLRAHPVGSLASWALSAGFIGIRVNDVRAYGREALAGNLGGDGSRIMAVVARKLL